MLKKTLLATAVALASTSAFAAPEWSLTLNTNAVAPNNQFETNVLAVQTKQPVLDKTSLDAIATLVFDNSTAGDLALEDAGEIVLTLNGDAEFNADKVAALLTASSAAGAPAVFNGGLLVNIADDDDNLAYAATTFNPDGTVNVAGADSVEHIKKVFKVDEGAQSVAIRYNLDNGNKRLSIKLADDVSTAGTAVDKFVGVQFDFYNAVLKQAFKLTSGSVSSVSLEFGALKDATYSAEPKSKSVFKLEDMFKLTQTRAGLNSDGADKTALVASTYTQWDNPTLGGLRAVQFHNNTTNQQIYRSDVTIALSGDFAPIAKNGTSLVDAGGVNQPNWTLSDGVVSAKASAFNGGVFANLDDTPLELPSLFIPADNQVNIEAQKYALKVSHSGNATYNAYSQTIGDAFIVVRDGMKFDTVTTGTTSSNVIYIRDVSKTLPEDGGKIFVTITEYAEHANDAQGAGEDVVVRKELSTRLPSNGAVTLTPVGIAADLGVELNPARQARFFFEVETNQGEAAVKKQTADGVDIQTGDKAAPVDFTL
ncbi:hypothetical protein [Vibrio rotiferianus]|uniref:VapA family S-layer protein n=1 Tax=Vibrio rotiferianus TaxID=190895 RepID=UPI0002376718|nr:hypothetical protein [Vibrio rotiferianus]